MKRAGFAFLLCVIAVLFINRPASQQGLNFTIINADQMIDWQMAGAPTFSLSVDPKFTIDTGDSTVNFSFTPLTFVLPPIAPKYTIDVADTTSYWSLAPLDFAIPPIAPKFTIDVADNTTWWNLAYPKEFINDTTPPSIVSALRIIPGSNTVTIGWTTNEYSTSILYYGMASGNTTSMVEDKLFAYTHQVSFPLPEEMKNQPGKTLYFKIQNTDRSGNSATSKEYQLNIKKIFLPMLRDN